MATNIINFKLRIWSTFLYDVRPGGGSDPILGDRWLTLGGENAVTAS